MNTQRLWESQLAKKSLDRAVAVLREFEESVCSPRSPRYDGMPGGGRAAETSLDAALDRKGELLREIDELKETVSEKHRFVTAIAHSIGGDEEAYCIEVYINGSSIKETVRKLHISRTTAYRLRHNILTSVMAMPD